jgi:CPA2 family monovalent cation:H+ antiporter-2
MPAAGRDLVLAVALLTIALNPAVFWLADRVAARLTLPPAPR